MSERASHTISNAEGIPIEAPQLRDAILGAVQTTGMPLTEHVLRVERGRPVLRLQICGRLLRGVWLRLPGVPTSDHERCGVLVHGSGYRASKAWPRCRDGSFNIEAIAHHLVALVNQELSHARTDVPVVTNVSASASGLHVVHVAAMHLGLMEAPSSANELLDGVADVGARDRIASHLLGGGLTEADLRALCDVVMLSIYRENSSHFDPFEPIGCRHLPILAVGERVGRRIQRRLVVVTDFRPDHVEIADPAGDGSVVVSMADLDAWWKLGAKRGQRWVRTVGVPARRFGPSGALRR